MSLAAQLLVASRKLRDPNFMRTVVLLLKHSEDGALGVVLNRIADRTVSEVWDAIDAEPCDCEQSLNLGGPVPGPLIALHQDESLAEERVMPGLFMSMHREQVDLLVRQQHHPFRLYSGNSGWGGGQLEDELKAGGWVLGPAEPEDVFADPNELWVNVSRRIGLSIILPGVDPDRTPDDPLMN